MNLKIVTQTEIFGGVEVQTTQLGGLDALELAARLVQVLSPALAHLPALTSAGTEGLMAADVSVLGPALSALFAQLPKGEAKSLVRDIFVATTAKVDGRLLPLSSDEGITLAFGADLKSLLAAVAFVVKVNFASFFADASSATSAPGASGVLLSTRPKLASR